MLRKLLEGDGGEENGEEQTGDGGEGVEEEKATGEAQDAMGSEGEALSVEGDDGEGEVEQGGAEGVQDHVHVDLPAGLLDSYSLQQIKEHTDRSSADRGGWQLWSSETLIPGARPQASILCGQKYI